MAKRALLMGLSAALLVSAPAVASAAAEVIPTFESMGVYWTPPANPGSQGCQIRFRASGESSWRAGYPLWFDSRTIGGRKPECRGSLVHLTPGTKYEIELGMPGQAFAEKLTASTWSESFPIGQTVTVQNGSARLDITSGGTASGYKLYTFPAGSTTSTIDVNDAADFNITISAPYVIIRGLTLKGAKIDAIRLLAGAHDVIIEDNDISEWGRFHHTSSGTGWKIGANGDSAISARCNDNWRMERLIVQRNKIHHPRYGSNSWDEGHPFGPQGIFFENCGGNHVWRYNEFFSETGRWFNDPIGGGANFSLLGFPNSDSDIYGNVIQHGWDDAIESEGANRNVRIWQNYMDRTCTGIATSSTSVGPIYVFRNVYNRSKYSFKSTPDSDQRLYFGKSGSVSPYGGGRRYLFHNTLLQPTPPAGSSYGLGAGSGIAGNGTDRPIENTVTRNNIWHIHKDWWNSINTYGGSGNSMDYDLYNGKMNAHTGAQSHGIVGTPSYAAGHGWSSEDGGDYELSPASPGYDKGQVLPNFNDDYQGAAPDIGAAEAGNGPVLFGVDGYSAPAAGGAGGAGGSAGTPGAGGSDASGGSSAGGSDSSGGSSAGGSDSSGGSSTGGSSASSGGSGWSGSPSSGGAPVSAGGSDGELPAASDNETAQGSCACSTPRPSGTSPTLALLALLGLGLIRRRRLSARPVVGFLAALIVSAPSLAHAATEAIPTFESLGLYWTPPANPGAKGCQVRFRESGQTDWRAGYPLWYDSRTIGGRKPECRGSLVHLSPGTKYEIELGMPGQSFTEKLTASTWSDELPIGETVYVKDGSAQLDITSGGTASGYKLYTFPEGSTTATLDVQNAADFNVEISAPYVIIRGLTLKGAKRDAIRLQPGAHDVVIEDNDISGWGRYHHTSSVTGWKIGENGDSGVSAHCKPEWRMERVVIQRNKIHHPRYGSNSWDEGHPFGANAIRFTECGGNHVWRYNEIYSEWTRYFMDSIGGGENFSVVGFPNSDTDIYGNVIRHTWDDAIESEGANRNVRIWQNYIDRTATGVASSSTSVGPLYVFRNVYNRSQARSELSPDEDKRLYFGKIGSVSPYGGGRRYMFHNTLLQAPPPAGSTYTSGAGSGISGNGSDRPIENTVSRNNIWQIHKDWWPSIDCDGGPTNSLDYDLYNGKIDCPSGAEPNGVKGVPVYASGHGWSSEDGGNYALDPTSPGFDAGELLPGFNDDFAGSAPDIGAAEAGKGPMRLGVDGHSAPTSDDPPKSGGAPSDGGAAGEGGTSVSVGGTSSSGGAPGQGGPIGHDGETLESNESDGSCAVSAPRRDGSPRSFAHLMLLGLGLALRSARAPRARRSSPRARSPEHR